MSEENGKTYKIVNSKFQLHSFSSGVADSDVFFQVLQMKNSLMIFINYKSARHLSDLSIALPNPQANNTLCSKIMGDFVSQESDKLATKISKKINKPVFVSYNIDSDRFTTLAVERELFRKIRTHPDKF